MKRLNHFTLFKPFILICGFLLFSATVFSQTNVTITGTVKDVNNTPLPGATILIKGSNEGTVTNKEGFFTITVQKTDSLIVDYVGYIAEQYAVGSNTTFTIQLEEDLIALTEVVVVGYGTMRKEDLTGSISSVSAEELHQGVITTTEQVLQGKVAGLTVIKGSGDPTSGATMRLRGGTSLIASSSPLVVIDGIAGVDINTVQPSEIESIDVLKDASAAAIYGSRGANGVIIITTTSPVKGSQVEYSNYVAFSRVANNLSLHSAEEWRSRVEEVDAAGAIDFGASTDWQKEIAQNAVSHSHTLSFNKASDNSGFRASVTYLDNEGVIKTSSLKRLGASISAYTYTLNEKLRLDFGTHTTFDDYNPVDYAVFERTTNLNPTAPVLDSTGAYFQVDGTNTENPVEILMNRNDDQTRKRLLGYAKAELEIISGLKGVLNTSYEYNSQQGRFYRPTYAQFGIADKGYASRSVGDYTNLQLETYLTYSHELESGHRFNIMGGYSYLDNTYEGFGSERRGFDTDLFLYNNLQAGQDYRATDVYSYKGNAKLISFFGRLNYSYEGKYMLTATLRNDGSSRFGENNKWGLFPSVAAAWTISEEQFMLPTLDWLNHLKLRGGYGVTGSQDAIGEYTTIALLGTQGGKYYDPTTESWKSSYSPIQNANPDLRWEKTTQVNVGIDLSVLNRLTATLDLYNKLTEDLIFNYAVPQPPNLYRETLANVGDLSNKGVEFTVDWKVMQRRDFGWNINLSMARNIMKIEKLSDEQYETDAVQSGSLHGLRGMSNQYAQTIREGYAVGTFWGPVCHGLDENGAFILDTVNSDLGNAQPKFSLGFNTGFTFKNFDLSISTYGLFGQKVLNATAMALNDPNRFPAQNVPHQLFDEGITSEPTYSSYWVQDASFFRLQSLMLGYTFRIDNAYIQKLRLFVNGENLFVLTNYSGVDPEIKIEDYNAATGRMDALRNPGIDRFDVYPKAKTISVGLNVIFN